MKCENCGKEGDKGQFYRFHYGHSQAELTYKDPLVKEYDVTAVVVGSDQAWICKGCVSTRVLLTLGLGPFIFLRLLLKLENVDVGYYSFSYRTTTLLGELLGPNLGVQISGVLGAVWATLLSHTVMTLWAIGGIAGGLLI